MAHQNKFNFLSFFFLLFAIVMKRLALYFGYHLCSFIYFIMINDLGLDIYFRIFQLTIIVCLKLFTFCKREKKAAQFRRIKLFLFQIQGFSPLYLVRKFVLVILIKSSPYVNYLMPLLYTVRIIKKFIQHIIIIILLCVL